MEKYNKKNLKKERQEAVEKIRQYLKTMNIGDEICMVLDASDFSHQDIADIIGCDRSNIVNICQRENHINLVQLILLSVALDYNFLDKICGLLKPEQENTLPERYTIDVTPSSVRITHQAEQVSVKIFRLQKE